MRIIMKQAFGSGKDNQNVVEHVPKTKEEAVMQLGSLFKK